MSVNSVNVLGVNVQTWQVDELHMEFAKKINNNQHALVLHVNAHGLNLAYENTWMRKLFNKADIVFCDGSGVILGAKLLGYRIPTRITYADWTWQLAEFAQAHGFTFFFLGGKPGIAAKAADQLKNRFPDLQILGTHDGYFEKTTGSNQNNEVIDMINAVKPDILLVAFGMPLQEKWLLENWDHIEANIALTGGAVFDYISGELIRSPRWMTAHGLEWLGRFLIEPGRLWRRYLVGNPKFIWRIILQRFGLLPFKELNLDPSKK
jgi:N-acetylglucosaminyldiphosphoundecaprenol N-acetyl-beta-D-mannosaminyltransferase